MRIRILGGPGSGKTTLALELSRTYKLKHVDLDDLYWDNSDTNYNTKRSEKERDKLLQKIVAKRNWVIEGVYGPGWTAATFEKADTIVILETSRMRQTWRLVKRYFVRKATKHKKRESAKDAIQLIKWSWKYRRKNLPDIKQEIAKHGRKIIVIYNPRPTVEDACHRR